MARTGSFRGGVTPSTATLYGAWTGEIYTVNPSGEVTLFSTLSGSDMPFFGTNNATNPGIAVVCDAGPFIINTTASAVQSYPDADVNSPSCCCGYLGYLFFGYGDGTMRVSDFNTTSINSLNQARAGTNPDGILNIFGYNGQIFALGKNTVEVWGEPINATGFPLTRVGFNILPGLMAKHAVAGWEPEWGYPPIWVGSDGTVRQLVGYQAKKVSNSDLDRALQAVSFNDIGTINAHVYSAGGHAFWQVNLPSESWTFHVNEGTWHKRVSQNQTDSRLARSVFFAEKWLVGDTESTDLMAMDLDTALESTNALTATMESGPAKAFPRQQRINRCDFDFTPGVGIATGTDPIQTDPEALIEVSYDGGRTWPHSWNRKLGKQAKSYRRIFVLNAGLTGDDGVRWRWSVSDPVHLGFLGADMDPEIVEK
jgi:hypothetical protein